MASNVDNMDELLRGLKQMQTTNPEAFNQAMQALGLPVTDSSGPSMPEDSSSLAQMAEAIKNMRSYPGAGSAGNDVLMSKDQPKQPKGISITPRPGFAFKTTRVSDGLKVVVNMAEHEAIDEPAMKKKLDDNGEEVEGMNIPMSVGAPVWTEDKKGVKCVVYDIIVNPVVVSEAAADKTGKYRDFICQLGMQYLEQKYKEELDKRYKLPKLKYMGDTIASQMIQDRKSMPKIQEVSSKTSTSAGSKGRSTNSATQDKNKAMMVEVIDKDLTHAVEWLSGDTEHSAAPSATELVTAFASGQQGSWRLLPYTHQSVEYLDPIVEPDDAVAAIVVTADVASYELVIPELSVLISPYKVVIKAPGYKKTTVHLACAIKPAASTYVLRRPYEGCVSAVRIQVILVVDRDDWALTADAGSKPWLLAQALSAETGDSNPYDTTQPTARPAKADLAQKTDSAGREVFAEDKFHLDLPEDVDPYTGVKLDGEPEPAPAAPQAKAQKATSKDPAASAAAAAAPEEEQEFAEDRFHRKDASSSYLINQRDQAKKDKWAKHEKEKAERASDPNVEYIDMEDFRPGGKYGPAEKETAREAVEPQKDELRRAAEVVAASATQQASGLQLSSALWTELLD